MTVHKVELSPQDCCRMLKAASPFVVRLHYRSSDRKIRMAEAATAACARRSPRGRSVVPLAGIEPALLAELDFESSASTSSATGAFGRGPEGRCGEAGGI